MRKENYWEAGGIRPLPEPRLSWWDSGTFWTAVFFGLITIVILSAPELYLYLSRRHG